MKTLLAALLLLLPALASAHRLDEYLEATLLSVESDRIEASVRLVPGVAVSSAVIASIDTNSDGTISDAEQQAYAQRVARDLYLSVDGRPLALRLASVSFPTVDEMEQGVGEIQLDFTAELPRGSASRRLSFENRHRSDIAVYLVNCLAPRDKAIHISAQSRNENQSFYQLDFVQGAGRIAQSRLPSFSGLTAAFNLGARHIAEGTDHLLFLLALLLPAPLLAGCGRWARRATVRSSLLQILRIVTAFTLGHSLTLALAAFGVVSLPSRLVEVLIAVSILVSATHAMRPLFPGREALIAGFFGLIHGLAFATALSDLGFGQEYRLVSLLGFNLGIEAMQLAVVVAVLPSLLLLSRTSLYSLFQVGGALFAMVASLGWIAERALDVETGVSPLVEGAAQRGVCIAAGFFLISLTCWLVRDTLAAASARSRWEPVLTLRLPDHKDPQ
jgi:hypothetical protein